MNKSKLISLALFAPFAMYASSEEALSVDSVITQTTSTANTVLAAAIGIGTVVLAWKFVRKFFGKTG